MPRTTRKTSSIRVPTVEQLTRKFRRIKHDHTVLTSARRVMHYIGYLSDPTPVLSQSVKGWDTSESYSLTFYYNLDSSSMANVDYCTLSVLLGDDVIPPYLFLHQADARDGTWRQWTIPHLSPRSVEKKLSFRYECLPIEPKDRYQDYLDSYLYLDDLSVNVNRDQSPF